MFGEPAQAVFDDDDRAIDDEAEIDCAEAHEVAADVELEHAAGGHEHGEGDGQCGNEGCAKVAQEKEEDDDHQDSAFGEVGQDGMNGGINELGAAEDGAGADVRGKADLLHACFGRRGDGATVGADQHLRRAHHDLVAILTGGSRAKLATNPDSGNVADVDGSAIALREDDGADLFEAVDAAADAHEVGLAFVLNEASASAGVVAFKGLGDIVKGQAVTDQLHGIGLDMVLLEVAALDVGVGDIADSLDLRPDDPVLDGAEISVALKRSFEKLAFRCEIGAIGLPARFAFVDGSAFAVGVLVLNDPNINLAKAGEEAGHSWLGAGGQLVAQLGEALVDLLACEVDIDVVLEGGLDPAEAVAGDGAGELQPGDAGQAVFDGEGDLLLDFHRRHR